MKTKKINLRPLNINVIHHHIQMSDSLQALFNVPLRSSIHLQCGDQIIHTKVSFIKDSAFTLLATPSVYQTLRLPFHDIPLKLTYDRVTHSISFGPIIAIVTDVMNDQSSERFGNIHDFCEEMADYCYRNHALLYVTSATKFQEHRIEGYVWEKGKWKYYPVPTPHVVYNRIHSRKFEGSHKFQEFMEKLHKRDIPIFNRRYLNKWETHQTLSEKSHLLPFLPKTALLDSKHVLQTYINDFSSVFVKPIHGSQGRNILQIDMREGKYFVKESSSPDSAHISFDMYGELFEYLHPRLKKETFLVQEAISIVRYENRPLDFRILCHKSSHQKWTVTSAIARVSAQNQFVSNMAKGGELHPIKTILSSLFDQTTHYHIRKLLYEVSLEAANVISSHVDGNFAEFGIDIALNEDGHPYILEVNTKPSKNMPSPSLTAFRPSVKAIANYCQLLSGYD